MAAIGQTAGMVGHDIRNPLQSIISELYLAKTEIVPMPEGQAKKNMIESLANIETEVNYINKIIQDLQDFSRPLSPAVRKIDLQVVCEEILAKKDIHEDVKASCRIDAGAKMILADPDAIRRAIENLVINATQAMPNGGELRIAAHAEEGTNIITVEDTGVGIPNEIRDKIFTPMVTTKAKGQGFGLAVAKRMIEAQNGSLTFESTVGKGTKFIIRLPTQASGH